MHLSTWRYAARIIRRNLGFSLAVVAILACGLALNTAVFSLVNTLLLKPLPFGEPDRLAIVWSPNPGLNIGTDTIAPSNADFYDWQTLARTVETWAGFENRPLNLSDLGDADRVNGVAVTGNFFTLLRVSAAYGRTLGAADDTPTANRVAVLSHDFWQTRLGGRADAVGTTLTLDGDKYDIVGIMPEGFTYPTAAELPEGTALPPRPDLWVATHYGPNSRANRENHNLITLARLAPGATFEQAQAEMTGIARQLEAQYPNTNRGWGARVESLKAQSVSRVSRSLVLLQGAVLFVLLITCANVAHLMLARANVRRREIAVCTAIGAGRSAIVGQLLAEAVILAVVSGVLGFVGVYWLLKSIVALAPEGMPRVHEVRLDAAVFAFTLGVSVVTSLLFGVFPALQISRTDLNVALRETSQTSGGGSSAGQRMRSALIVAEVALTLMLLFGAGLLVRSFVAVQRVNPGFDPSAVTALDISLPNKLYRTAETRTAFFDRLMADVRTLPQVEAVGAVSSLPLSRKESRSALAVEGFFPDPGQIIACDNRMVTPDYFRAMRIPLRTGRYFETDDAGPERRVAIVNEAIVRRFFPNQNPIGRQVKIGSAQDTNPWFSIVGVVADVKHSSLESVPLFQLYRPYPHNPQNAMTVVVRSATAPSEIVTAIRQKVAQIDPKQPIYNARPMTALVAASVEGRRTSLMVLGLFAALAIGLTLIGLYGVISYSIAQRRGEFGLRLALGAERSDVVRLILWTGMKLVLLGTVLGAAGAIGVSRIVEGLVYGIAPLDPITLAAVCFSLVFVSVLACCMPALRASRINPVIALRSE